MSKFDKVLRDSKKKEHVRVTVYLSKEAYEFFKQKCGTLSVSKGLDLLIRETFGKEMNVQK